MKAMSSNGPLLWLYRQALGLFPGSFRHEFEDEMTEVVRQASEQAGAQGRLAWLEFWLREFGTLPACLAREHWMAITQTEAEMSAQPALQGGNDQAPPAKAGFPLARPRDLFLTALPHLLVGLLLCLAELGVLGNLLPKGSPLAVPATIVFWLVVIGGLLWVFISAWRSGWPGWSGAWLTYIGVLAFAGLGALTMVVGWEDGLNRSNIFYLVLAALVSFGLYRITRGNALHGVLAGLTVVAVTGIPSFEFVPPGLKAGVAAFGWLALTLTSVLVLRAGTLPRSLPLAILGSLLILLPFAWVGIYHGGMLYFDAPGPSWVQVLRVGLPLFSLATCLLLGPQLARQLRQLEKADQVKHLWRYRLALLGELSLLAGVVFMVWQHTSDDVHKVPEVATYLLAAGFLLLGLGTGLVVLLARRLPGRVWAGGLYLALLGLPWALLASLPGPVEYFARTTGKFPLALTHYPEFGLHLSALFWALLAAWVILSGERSKPGAGSLPARS